MSGIQVPLTPPSQTICPHPHFYWVSSKLCGITPQQNGPGWDSTLLPVAIPRLAMTSVTSDFSWKGALSQHARSLLFSTLNKQTPRVDSIAPQATRSHRINWGGPHVGAITSMLRNISVIRENWWQEKGDRRRKVRKSWKTRRRNSHFLSHLGSDPYRALAAQLSYSFSYFYVILWPLKYTICHAHTLFNWTSLTQNSTLCDTCVLQRIPLYVVRSKSVHLYRSQICPESWTA